MLKLGNRNISKMCLGGRAVSKAYLGSNLVYSAAQPLPYDAEVQYLESTGTQLVDTGIYGRDNLLCNIRFALTNIPTSGSRYVFIGFHVRSLLGVFVQGSTTAFRFGAITSLIANSVASDLDIHDACIDTTSNARRVVFDGAEVYSGVVSFTGQYSNPIGLFGRIGYNEGCQARIYSFSVTDATTGEKIQDLIPVRKNGVGYMYDRVSGHLLGNSGTGDFIIGPDKPYDYEVAYIEMDCSIPWVDSDGNEILGYFDLSRYEIADETLSAMRPLEATWSFEPISDGYAFAISIQNLFLTRGCMKPPNKTTYGFAYQSGQFSEIEGNIDTFHKQRLIYQDGHVKGYIDDILVVDEPVSGNPRVQRPRVLYTLASTSSYHYNGKARVRNVRLGSDVYLIPVVKGNEVGFYNTVDGEMFLADQSCLKAGPRV